MADTSLKPTKSNAKLQQSKSSKVYCLKGFIMIQRKFLIEELPDMPASACKVLLLLNGLKGIKERVFRGLKLGKNQAVISIRKASECLKMDRNTFKKALKYLIGKALVKVFESTNIGTQMEMKDLGTYGMEPVDNQDLEEPSGGKIHPPEDESGGKIHPPAELHSYIQEKGNYIKGVARCRAKSPKVRPDSRKIDAIYGGYAAAFQERYGFKPFINDRHRNAAKLAKEFELEEILGAVEFYLASQRDHYKERTHPFELFFSDFNRLNQGARDNWEVIERRLDRRRCA